MSLSTYERRARLVTGSLAIAPIAITIVALGLTSHPSTALLFGTLSATVGGYLLSVVVGNAGRRVEVELFDRWGGRPTTQLLRTRGSDGNAVQRDVWRGALETVTGISLLTKRREKADPVKADQAIEAAVDSVRYLGRDPRFPAVSSENTAYGFERNLWGFRWYGRAVAAASLLAGVAVYLLKDQFSISPSMGTVAVNFAVNLTLLGVWLAVPSERRVREAGYRYASQLLQAVTQLSRTGPQGEDQPNATAEDVVNGE